MTERGTLTVTETSWHARLYRWWQAHGGKTPGRENLCHYVRTVLFWAPLKWSVKAHPNGVDWLRPATAFSALALLTATILSTVIWPVEVLKAVLFIGATAAVLAALVGTISWLDGHQEGVQAFFRRIGNALAPLGRVLTLFGRFIADTWMALVVIVSVLAVLGFATAWYVWPDTINPVILTGLVWTAGIVASIAAIAFVAFVIGEYVGPSIGRWWVNRSKKSPGMVRVTGRYVVAKKRKVCPFIDFREH